MCTSLLSVPSAAYADGGDMSPPYRGCFVYHGAFSRVDCEERYGCGVPFCGCAPYGGVRSMIVGHDDLGVPSAKRQTVQTNEFVHIW